MDNYGFYKDEKITVWKRYYFDVEADSKEDAVKKVIGMIGQYGMYSVDKDCYNSETLWDTESDMSVEKNGGYATIRIYDEDGEEIINNKDLK